jgi:RHS repeat-associated protein
MTSLPADIREKARDYVEDLNTQALGSVATKVQYGVPRRVKTVTIPAMGVTSQFAKSADTQMVFGPQFSAASGTEITDATGKKYKYSFGGVEGKIIDKDSSQTGLSGNISTNWLIYYTSMTLSYLGEGSGIIGSETYEFDPASGLSLKRSVDFSGNETTWTYDEDRPESPRISLADEEAFLSVWADPTTKTDALGRVESYAYGNHRMLSESTDVHGTKTTYNVDALGRRTSMIVTDALEQKLLEETYDYAYSDPEATPYFPGFMSRKTRKAASETWSGKTWEQDMVVAYSPDSYGRVGSEIVDPGAGGKNLTTVYTYNKNNQRLTSRDPKLNTTNFEYDGLGRLVKTIFADTSFKEFGYDYNNARTSEIDENGVATFSERDGLGRVVKVARDLDKSGTINGGDIITRMEYNTVGLVTKVIDPRGFATVTSYDTLHRPAHVYGGVPAAQTAGNLAALAAGSREITHNEMFYDIASNTGGGLSSPFRATRTTRHGAVSMDRDAADVSLTDSATFDEVYRPLSATTQYQSGLSRTETTTYNIGDTNSSDGKDTLVSETKLISNSTADAPHKVTRTTVDGLGRVVQVIDGFGFAADLVNTSTTYYTSTGLTWKVIDPLSRVTETEYDRAGRPVKVWQPDPATGLITANSPMIETVYDDNGNVVAVIDPLVRQTDFDFDVRNRNWRKRAPAVTDATVPTALVTGVRPTTSTVFDAVGNPISVTDPRGNTTRTFYDAANRPLMTRSNPVTGTPSADPGVLGTYDITTTTTLDAGGLATSVTDGNGNVTRNAYDGLGRLVATACDPADGMPADPGAAGFNEAAYRSSNTTCILVTTEYDDAGNIVEVIDGAGQVTAFTYDGFARKTRTLRDPETAVEKVEVSVFNEFYQTSRVDAAGRKTLYRYDDRQRLVDVVYAPVGSATTSTHSDNRHLTYDKVGKVTAVTYPNDPGSIRATSSSYDLLDRLTSETSGGVTHAHTSYDKAGNRLVTTYGRTDRTLVSAYDALNRLLTCDERVSALASSGQVTTYAYDLGGKVTAKFLPGGVVTHTTYDKLGRTLVMRDLQSGTTEISRTDYSDSAGTWPTSYDAVGNVLRFESWSVGGATNRVVDSIYDHCYRLTNEVVDSSNSPDVTTDYGYDRANNRTSKVLGTAETVYVYGNGANGGNSNQLLRYGPSGQTATHVFGYDDNGNRLTKVTSVGTQSHVWDFENRLISVTMPSGAHAGVHSYVYDHRGRRVVRNESSAGGVETRLTYSGGTSVQEANTADSVQCELIRGNDWGGGVGGILYTIRGGERSYNSYNSRGDVVSVTNGSGAATWEAAYEAFGTKTVEVGTNAERQRANTKEEDPTGLLNEGLRYRDLEVGVFISRDPAGFIDGPNDYTYVRQNPWSAFDPHGLSMDSVGDWLHENFGPAGDGIQGLAAWEDMYQVSTRTSGAAQALGGIVEGAFGAAATPATAGAGALAFVHGADNVDAGLKKLFFGQHFNTHTYQGIYDGATFCGAYPEVAHNIAFGGDLTIAVAAPTVSIAGRLKSPLAPSAYHLPQLPSATARVVVAQSNAGVVNSTRVATNSYGSLADELSGSGVQANHLNQNAAYKGVIPEAEGIANAMRGNAFTEVGSPHYEFHSALEQFWAPYRKGGGLFGQTPTNGQYGDALEQALLQGGYTQAESANLAQQAAAQRAAYGLSPSAPVPKIPGRLPQKRRP